MRSVRAYLLAITPLFDKMMRGMWTKQYTKEGKEYYFNATTNQAQWKVPPDAVVHEAERLVNPNDLSAEDLEKFKNERAALSFDSFELMPARITPVVAPLGPPSGSEITTDITTSGSIESIPAPQPHIYTPAEIEERINAIASQKQQQAIQQHKSSGNKRFKSQASEEAEVSEYQKMVNDITAQAGLKSDDGGKWLVR